MIYLYDDFTFDEFCLKNWERLLNQERRNKVERYKFQKDKALCCIAFLLLRFGLAQEFHIFQMPELGVSVHKKPFLRNIPVCFNFSHCDNAVACAIDRKPVGIDIQHYTEQLLSVRHRILTEKEYEKTEKYSPLTETARFWTLKEAYGKFYGYGLDYPFQETDFSQIENASHWQKYEDISVFSMLSDSYALCVCAEKNMPVQFVTRQNLNEFAEKISGDENYL